MADKEASTVMAPRRDTNLMMNPHTLDWKFSPAGATDLMVEALVNLLHVAPTGHVVARALIATVCPIVIVRRCSIAQQGRAP
jgi:hypothetical protein